MKCPQCGDESVKYLGVTDDAKSRLRCSHGHTWEHGPTDEEPHIGHPGGQKFHCPVCEYIFEDQTAPIITIGTPSREGHRCDKTKSFLLGTTYGASEKALDSRLAELDDASLADWPRVLEMKRERLSGKR